MSKTYTCIDAHALMHACLAQGGKSDVNCFNACDLIVLDQRYLAQTYPAFAEISSLHREKD